MLSFATQSKILGQLLKNPANHYCADCNTKSPTWVSLDFGVFLCSNCSGAHRALGPTVTRVRSANLDQWQEVWVENMRLGNTVINKHFQHENLYAVSKPKPGASLQDSNRYVILKYVKRKFAKPGKHPLQAYKDGQLTLQQCNAQNIQKSSPKLQPKINEVPVVKPKTVQLTAPQVIVKKQSNLLQDLLQDLEPKNSMPQNHVFKCFQQGQQNKQEDDDDFTAFTSGSQQKIQDAPAGTSPNQSLSYDELLKNATTHAQPINAININGHAYLNPGHIQSVQYPNQFAYQPTFHQTVQAPVYPLYGPGVGSNYQMTGMHQSHQPHYYTNQPNHVYQNKNIPQISVPNIPNNWTL